MKKRPSLNYKKLYLRELERNKSLSKSLEDANSLVNKTWRELNKAKYDLTISKWKNQGLEYKIKELRLPLYKRLLKKMI